MHHPTRRRLRAASWRSVALAFALLADACAGSTGALTPIDAPGWLYAGLYDQIDDLYIEPERPPLLAMAGLGRLATLDGRLAIVREQGNLVVRRDGDAVARFVTPGDDDALGWGALTAAAASAARGSSSALAELSEDRIEQTVIDGVLSRLDRFSRYAPPDTANEHRASRDGFSGIGVTLDYGNDEVRVSAVLPESPAARAGVQAEDRIARIDDVEIASLTRHDIVRRLRGPIDTRVEVTFARPGRAQPLRVSLRRAFLVVPTVKTTIDGNIAIMRISSFNHSTAQQIAEQFAAARRRAGAGLRGLVLDLRGNPGGLLDQSVAVADLFLTSGTIIATQGRHRASRQYFRAAPDDIADGLPIVVLVNGGSASAAEIVAAALQDQGRAVVVGSASYGKGTVQTVLRLANDGELTLTWAKLVSPSGYVLHEHGVVPTICTAHLGDTEAEIRSALRRGTVAAAAGTPAARRRVDLDEAGWGELRRSCPMESGDHAVELKAAKRLLADRTLYSHAIHPIAATVAASRPGG